MEHHGVVLRGPVLRRIVAIVVVAWVAGTAPARSGAPAPIPRWEAFGDPRIYTTRIDPAQAHDGVAPLQITATGSRVPIRPGMSFIRGGAGWMLDALPYRGKRVRLHGELKTERATRAALILRVDRIRPVRPYTPNEPLWQLINAREGLARGLISGDPVRGDHDWTEVQIETEIPGDALAVVVGDQLVGEGTLWATYPTLEVVGPARAPEAAATPIGMVSPQLRAAVETALERSAVKLRTDDPAAPLDDLRAFDREVADSRVIGLGQASPGSAEFFRMKQRLLRDLVERHGVTVLAVDAGVVEARAMERYVSAGAGDPADALRRLGTWQWQNGEMLALARWMRAYNATAGPQKMVHFAGLDAQWFVPAAESVQRFASARDAALGKTVQAHYACIPRTFAASTKLFNSDSALRACVRRVGEVAKLLAPLRPDADVAHDARVVEQYTHVRLELAHDARGGESSVMEAENVEWLARTRYPNAKVAVWSTNREIGSKLDAVPGLALGRGTLGSSLARRFGRSYAAIGFAFDRGSVTVRGPNGIRPANVTPAPEGTLESVLRDAGDRFYLSLRSLRRDDPLGAWLDGETLSREISPFYFVETSAGLDYTDAIERERFDALIFIAQSRPTSAFRTARPPPGVWFPTAEGTIGQIV
jgi:erythromycin esterase-like protein